MRELRGQRHAAVAEGRHRPSSVQRVRSVQQDQRGEPAAGQVGPEENHPGKYTESTAIRQWRAQEFQMELDRRTIPE